MDECIAKRGPEIFPDVYLLGYDKFGRPMTNNLLFDTINNKEMELNDDLREDNN